MLKNFLFISFRYIIKRRNTSAMNIFCLSLGGAICLLIWSFLSYEFGFDQSFTNPATYRLEMHDEMDGGAISKNAFVSSQDIASWANNNIEELQHLMRLVPYSEEGNAFFSALRPDGTNGRIHIKNIYYSDPSIFDVFPVQILQQRNDYKGPGIWLSKSLAISYFGEEFNSNPHLWDFSLDPIRNSGLPTPAYQIVGIYDDLKPNTHVQLDAFIITEGENNPLDKRIQCYAYVTTENPVENNTDALSLPYLQEDQSIYMRPVTSIHFTRDISNNQKPVANSILLIFLAFVGFIILMLSITNYTIGAIFNTIERMREIGIRKLIGMKPVHLVANFFTEAFLIHLLAGVFAVAIFQYMVNHSLPFLPDQKEIGMSNPLDLKAIGSIGLGNTIVFAFILFLGSTILSSLYPTLYFNKIKPVHLLKGKIQLLNSSLLAGATRVTEILLFFQLAASAIFLSGLFMVNSQMDYLNNQQLSSFDLEVRGIFPGVAGVNTTFNEMAELVIAESRQHGWLRDISYTNLYRNQLSTTGTIEASIVESDSLKALKLHIVDRSYWSQETTVFRFGQNFSTQFGVDPTRIILNEAAIRKLGLESTESVIGDTIYSNMGTFTILGVVSEPKEDPIAYANGFRYRTYVDLTLHYDAEHMTDESVFDFLRAREVQLSTAFPFMTILKRDFQKERFLEQGIGGLFLLFSMLALLIASFGLFSLSSFLTEKQAKEMDIRKLLGANQLQLIQLVSSNLFQMLCWAILVTTPVVFFAGNYWLDQYSGRVEFDILWVLKPALLILVVSLLVAIPKSWQKARSNLATSLRG